MVSSGVYPVLPERVGAIDPYIYGLSKSLAKTNYVDVLGVGEGELRAGNLHIYAMPYVQRFQRSLAKVVDWRLGYYIPFNLCILKAITELHRKNPIDILHIHEVFAGFAANACKYFLGIPYVCSVHNEIRNILPIQTTSMYLPVSSYIQDFLCEKKLVNKRQVTVLPIAIEPSDLETTKSAEEAKKELGLLGHKVILFIGRKCPEKGPQILINALPRIVKHNPTALAVIIGPDLIFGGQSSTYTNVLNAKAHRLQMQNNVVLKGYVSNYLKKLYLMAADVVVFPSIWREPAGIVLLEAMAFGKPVVASAIGGVPDFIRDKYNGLLVTPNSCTELSEAVNFVLEHTNAASQLGKNGLISVQQYSFDKIGKRCLKIYHSVL